MTSANAEYKLVTALIADVVGSSAHTEALGAERWREWLTAFYTQATAVVERYEGTVSRFTGDGVMAVFGAPVAHENHAVRACLAALDLHAVTAGLDGEVRLRIGVSSGEAVVGRIGAGEYTAIGSSVNLAKRLEARAPAGSTALSPATARLAGTLMLRPLGTDAHELLGPGEARTAPSSAPLVGRPAELAVLKEAYAQGMAGNGQVLGLVGEPGVGKSRLARTITAQAVADGTTVLEAVAPSHGHRMDLSFARQLVRELAGPEPADALLRDFLGIAGEAVLPTIGPSARLRRLLEATAGLLRSRSDAEPLVLLLEDLHWMDAASAPFLACVAEASSGGRVLLLTTMRPEADVGPLGTHLEVAVAPLPDADMADLLGYLLGNDPAVAVVARRAAGNAFFAEEMARELLGADRPDADALPATVQATLSARLDRLDPALKQLAGDAAVLGERGSVAVLDAIAGEVAEDGLARLAAAGILQDDAGKDYAFRHPLTREVAYRSQLRERRRDVHGRAMDALARAHAHALDANAGLLAYHAAEAGRLGEAAAWHARAAVWVGRTDTALALAHWRQARDMADALPAGAERDGLSLGARLGILTTAWHVAEAEAEVEEAYTAALVLLPPGPGADATRYLMHFGRASCLMVAGRMAESQALARRHHGLAMSLGDPAMALIAQTGRGWIEHYFSPLSGALEHLDAAVALARADPSLGVGGVLLSPAAQAYTQRGFVRGLAGSVEDGLRDFEMALVWAERHEAYETHSWAFSWRCLILGLAGMPERGAGDPDRALGLAKQAGSRLAAVNAYFAAAVLAEAAGDWDGVEIAAAEGHRHLRRTGLLADLASHLEAPQAAAALARGDVVAAERFARKAVAIGRATPYVLGEVMGCLVLAEVLRATGDLVSAQASLGRADALTAATGLRLLDDRRAAAALDGSPR